MAPDALSACADWSAGTASTGGVASRLNDTVSDDGPPSLEALQVYEKSAPSVDTVTASQPDVDAALSASVTVQLTVTSLVYQPLLPCVPVIVCAMTGGVESATIVVAVADAACSESLPSYAAVTV